MTAVEGDQGLKAWVRRTLLTDDTRLGEAIQLFIQALIVLSVVGFTIDTLPTLDERWRLLLRQFEVFAIAVFTVEYLLRLWVADNRLRFATSFYGVIDLLVILPFYLQLGLDLRSLRVFWLFRIFRLFKLARYGDAARRMAAAFRLVRVDLAVFGVGAVFVLYLAAVGIYFSSAKRSLRPSHP
jgi:voltage-gated potassium channel